MSLFAYYPGSVELIAAAGDELAAHSAAYDTLQTNLDSRSAAAADETAYAIQDPVATAAQEPRGAAGELSAAALLAKGALRHFASAVQTYNGHIDTLNTTYERAKATNFGYPDGEDSSEDEQSLRLRLERQRQGYEDVLDDEADLAGCLLSDGPTTECMLTLYTLGAISIDDAMRVTGLTLSYLNQVRMVVGTSQFVLTSKKWLPVFMQYLLKVNSNEIQMKTALKLAQLVKDFGSLVDRGKVAEIYSAVQRMDAMVAVSKPGPLVGKFRTNGLLGGLNKWVGRLLSPGAVLAGGWGLFQTFENWDDLALDAKINGVVGNTSFMTFGTLGTVALLTGWCPPVAAAIATGAGLVALASMVYDYKEEIWEGIQWAGARIADGAVLAWDGVTWLGETVWDGVTYAWDATTEWAGEQVEAAADLIEDGGDLAVAAVTGDTEGIVDGAENLVLDILGG